MDYSKLSDKELYELKQKLTYDVSKFRNKQEALKRQINSAYGLFGNEHYRYYDIRLAEAVTKTGQYVIRSLINNINDSINKTLKTDNVDYIIGGDTDSLYLSCEDVVNKLFDKNQQKDVDKVIKFLDKYSEQVIQPIINKTSNDITEYLNCPVNSLKMKREALSDSVIWLAKKHYIMSVKDKEGVRFNPAKVIMKGIEAVRTSTPEVVRLKIKELLNIILYDTEEASQKCISDFKKQFKTLKPEEIAFPRTVSGLNKYSSRNEIYIKGTPIQTRSSLLYNKKIKDMKLHKKYDYIKEGEKMKFIYLKEPNTLFDDVIAFIDILPVEFELEEYIDYDKQFEVSFMDPVAKIYNTIGWKPKKQINLSCFFED